MAWWWVALEWSAGYRKMEDLADQPLTSFEDLPSLSIVVPARNESAAIEQSLASILKDAPPGSDVVLIDDRSGDGTREIVHRMAREDSRLKVLTVDQLPQGWLGKNHALQKGADESEGDWILFTDADVHFEPGCLARALDYARKSEIDHLVVAPRMKTHGFWERVFVSFFVVALLTWLRAWRVNQRGGRGFFGIGAFNMVRRPAYERAGQHAALKDEVIDDLHDTSGQGHRYCCAVGQSVNLPVPIIIFMNIDPFVWRPPLTKVSPPLAPVIKTHSGLDQP